MKSAPALPLKLASLLKTSEACPTEWFGSDSSGNQVFIHYRAGHLIVRVAEGGRTRMDAVSGTQLFSHQVDNDRLRGSITFEKLRQLTKHILQLPRSDKCF